MKFLLELKDFFRFFWRTGKKDKEIVLEAVTNFGDALEFADESLKKDKDRLEKFKRLLVDLDIKFDEGDYHFTIRLTDKEGWSIQKGLSIKMFYQNN